MYLFITNKYQFFCKKLIKLIYELIKYISINNKMNNDTLIKNATGTRDLNSKDIAIREYIFKIAKECFVKRGVTQLDTPVLELFGLVKNLYGDEFNKLVYKLEDGGAYDLLLRYDLTVPLARYVVMNGIKFLRRFQIGKVYRRDDPQIEKGRYREFYQCDFDIIGDDQNTNIFDTEIFDVLVEILEKLLGNKFIIKISDRNILYTLLRKFGVCDEQINLVCSTLDKLDKKNWNELSKELKLKNISQEVINNLENLIIKINDFNKIKDNSEQINKVLNYLDEEKIDNSSIKNILLNLVELDILKYIQFDLSLARGLDYYTGIIFEVKYLDGDIMQSTISSGGRYDNVIGKLSGQTSIPAIGMSLGIERLATILEKTKKEIILDNQIEIYVASIGENMIRERIKLCCELRKLGLTCVMSHLKNPKMRPQFDEVFNMNIPYMIVIGEDEIKNNILTIKDVKQNVQHKKNKNEGIEFLLNKLKS